MGKSCVFDFNAKDEITGEVGLDILWQELKDFTGSHAASKVYYGIATNREFTELTKDTLRYNSQGLPTLESLLEAMNQDYDREKLRHAIQNSVGNEEMNYSKAIYKIQSFNRLNMDSSFMLDFQNVENGKVRLVVVDNNMKNQGTLIQNVKKRAYLDRLMYYLRNAGFDVKFLEDNKDSVFNVDIIEKNCEGLAELIELSNETSRRKLRADLSDMCGRLIINALPKDILIDRLRDVIDNEEFREEFNEINSGYLSEIEGTGDWKDIAGYLIGQKLNQEVDLQSNSRWAKIFRKVGSLIDRILQRAIGMFKKIPSKEYRAALREANEIATEIAQGFMSPEFKGTVGQALTSGDIYTKEGSRTARNVSTNVKVANFILDSMSNYVRRIKDHDATLFKALRKELALVESKIDFSELGSVENSLIDEDALISIVNAVEMLIGNYTNVVEKVNKMNFDEEADFINNMGHYVNAVNSALLWANTATYVSEIIDAYTVKASDIDGQMKGYTEIPMSSKYSGTVYKDLREINGKLKYLIKGQGKEKGIIAMLDARLRSFEKRFLTEIIGADLISRGDRVLFKGGLKVGVEEGRDYTIEELIDTLGDDISWWSQKFRAMADNPDIIGQAFDKIVKAAKLRANTVFLQHRDELLLLEEDARKLGVNFDDLVEWEIYEAVEKYHVGQVLVTKKRPNGYIKQDVDWGRWHRSFEVMLEEQRTAFEEKYGRRTLRKMRESERCVLWQKFYHEAYVNWHKENSDSIPIKDDAGNVIAMKYVPKANRDSEGHAIGGKYFSDSYSKLTNEQRHIVDRWMDIKKKLDALLPERSTETARLPQILGSTMNQIANRRFARESLSKAVSSTLMTRFCNSLVKNANDTDYGSDATVNRPDSLHDEKSAEDYKYERVPLFYINLLPEDKRIQLSTDIIGSTIAYASMANQYSYLSKIKDAVQLTHSGMKKRRIRNDKGDLEPDRGRSNAYKRLTSYLDKELYGLLFSGRMSNSRAILAKFVQMTSAFASRMFLGGNIQGAGANFNMGFVEVLKEAIVGEYFTMADWRAATKEYFIGSHDSDDYNFFKHNLFVDSLKQIKENKLNMFAEYMDIFGDNRREARSYDFRNLKLAFAKKIDVFYHNAFAPYAAGDHYMQIMPFVALAKATKLYYKDENGRTVTTNVYDIYERQVSPTGSSKGLLRMKREYYTKNRRNVDLVNKIDSFIKEIEALLKIEGRVIITDNMEEKYADIIKKYNLTINNAEKATDNENSLAILKQRIEDMTWLFADEAAYKDKARQISNRLHGIYNQQDKVEMQLNILGNSILAMRGYALGMIERRWGGSHYSLALGKEVEGSALTAVKAILSIFNRKEFDGLTVPRWLSMGFLPMLKPTKMQSMMEQLGFSESQFYNLRRTLMDWAVMFIGMALVGGLLQILGWPGLLGKGKNDDPKDYYPKNSADFYCALAYYFVSRLYIEQSAYNEIVSFTNVEGPSAFTLFGSNIGALVACIRIIQGYIEGDYKEGTYKYQSKGKIRLYKYVPYLRWKYTVKPDPRKSAEAFEVNRGSYGR